MRTFNYTTLKDKMWNHDILCLVAAIYKEAGKQELYLKQSPEKLEKLVEIAKVQSTEASNAMNYHSHAVAGCPMEVVLCYCIIE